MSLLHQTFAEMKRRILWDDSSYKGYKLKTPNEVEMYGKAKCSDAIFYLREQLKDSYNCLPVRMLIKSDRPIGMNTYRDNWIHVFMIVYDNCEHSLLKSNCKSSLSEHSDLSSSTAANNQLYLVEWRWCEVLSGVFGPFDSLPYLIAFVEHVYLALLKEKYKQQFVFSFAPFEDPVYGAAIDADRAFDANPYYHPPRIYERSLGEHYSIRSFGTEGSWNERRMRGL